jgi:hypothetical protein
MSKFLDITGQIINDRYILRRGRNRGQLTTWDYKCIRCGKEGNTISNGVRSYGCSCKRNKETSERERNDLTGKQYDWLKVIKMDHVDKHRKLWYLVRCKCGVEFVANGRRLQIGQIKNCKQCRKIRLRLKNVKKLLGHETYFWKVLKFDKVYYNKAYWWCECKNCGKIKSIVSGTLIQKLPFACGCIRSATVSMMNQDPDHIQQTRMFLQVRGMDRERKKWETS